MRGSHFVVIFFGILTSFKYGFRTVLARSWLSSSHRVPKSIPLNLISTDEYEL